MEVGTIFKIKFEGSSTQFTSELAGKEDDNYLMVKWPASYTMANDSDLIYKDNTTSVKYLYEGVEFGFQSRILEIISDPAKLIFIEYPKTVDVCVLRENRRIDCFLPASLRIADNIIIDVNITNISRSGCQVVAETSEIEKNMGLIETENGIGLSFQLPGIEEEITLTVKQRSIEKGKNDASIGIEFNKMSVEAEAVLHDYLSKAGI